MTFELSKEHEDFRAVVREFAQAEVAPHAAQWDREHTFPTDAGRPHGRAGAVRARGPRGVRRVGHVEGAFTSLCVAIEELGRVDQSVGITLSAGVGLGINPILTFGTAEQKDRWLPDLVAGRALGGVRADRARRGIRRGRHAHAGPPGGRGESAEWVVDGAKAFITNSGTDVTSVVTVTARTGTTSDGRAEVRAILIPSGTAGFTVEPAYDKLGWHASDTHGLTFEGVRVPEAHLLGERGGGFRQFLKTLDDGRIAISALAVGLAQACLEASTDYAKTRVAFGRPIGANQGIAFQISDLAVAVEAARLLTYKAAWLKDEHAAGRRGRADVKAAAAVAKLHSTEAAVAATRVATQVFGGNGFMEEYPVARFYRDAKILEIGEGTSEVQRMVIARGLGLLQG